MTGLTRVQQGGIVAANLQLKRENDRLHAELASARAELETMSERLRKSERESDTLAAIVLAL